MEHVSAPSGPTPRAHLLAYGDFSILLTAAGSGWMKWKGLDVTRWRDDAALDASGSFCYLRDLGSGAFWSAAYQPTMRRPDTYDAAFAADRITLHRRDGDIETLTEIVVSPEHPAEVRRVTVTNHSSAPRRIELTTYAEVVLASRGADLAHPVFSNMFVETEASPAHDAILATRRPRTPDDPTPWVVQVMAVEEGQVGAARARDQPGSLRGRGRTLEAPLSMVQSGPLAGTTGTVLDPVSASAACWSSPPAGGRGSPSPPPSPERARRRSSSPTGSTIPAPAPAPSSSPGPTPASSSSTWASRPSGPALPAAGIGDRLPDRRAPGRAEVLARNGRGKESLWRYGISATCPSC